MRPALGRWIIGFAIAAVATALFLAEAARAQEAVGTWHGTLSLPNGVIRLGVRLAPAGESLSGVIYSPEQSGMEASLADVRREGDHLSFAYQPIGGKFEGEWDPKASAWVGDWVSAAGRLPLTLSRGDIPKAAVVEGLDGNWQGALAIGERKLRIVVRVRTGAYGTVALLDSPDQLAGGFVLTELGRKGDDVSFAQPQLRASFAGKLSADGQSIVGALTQGGTLPLTLTRFTPTLSARPQTPQRPYPYREAEVAVDSVSGVRLACTLTTPEGKGADGKGRFPAAFLITGSGPQDRDETLVRHKPFLVLADHLTRRGIAVLRCDDRGFGKSTGDFAAATSTDFNADAAAAVAFLRSRAEIDPARVGLIGHSEGGLIGPMVAAGDPKIAFVVMLAGPGVPSRDLMTAQREAIGRATGATAEAMARGETLSARIDEAIAQGRDWETAKTDVVKIIGAEAAALGVPADTLLARSQLVLTPWYRDFIRYDPRPTLAKLRMPVLALNGSNDTQVVAAQNLPAIRAALKENPDATVEELPGLNHLFQTSKTGAPTEYAIIEETFAPSALKVISDWITARVGR